MQRLFNLGSILFSALTIAVVVAVLIVILTPQSYTINLNPVTPTKPTTTNISAAEIPTTTPNRPITDAQLRVRTNYPTIIIIRSHKKGGCDICFSCSRLDTYLSDCTTKNDMIEAVVFTQSGLKHIGASPDLGTAAQDEESYRYTYNAWNTGKRTITFTIGKPAYLRSMPQPDDLQINPEIRSK